MKELIEIQNELKAPKSNHNKFGNYNYRSAEDILEALKPLLKKHACQLILGDEVKMMGDRFYVCATAVLVKGEERVETQGWAREALNKKGMDDSQITGTASSYARKYALNGLFLIDDTKDADTNEYHNQSKKAEKKNFDKELGETISEAQGKVLGQFIKQIGMSTEDAFKELGVTRLGEVTVEGFSKFFKDHEAKEEQETLEV